MPFILGIENEFPPYYYSQEELSHQFLKLWKGRRFNTERVLNLFRNVQVNGRYLSMPIESYKKDLSFSQKNDTWIKMAVELGTKCLKKIFNNYPISPQEIGLLCSTTVTGLSVPSIDARLMNYFDFSPQTKRLPLFGLGCLAGVAGINRLGDYLKAYPQEAALLYSCELCSLTVQIDDLSIANMISTGLFGDGAACVLMVGDDHPLARSNCLEWLDGESCFFPDTERVMGWDFVDTGFKIVLNKSVPDIAKEKVKTFLEEHLKKFDLHLKEISFFATHPGGPKVLLSLMDALDLSKKDLFYSFKGLEEHGNISSTSVLLILKSIMDDKEMNQGLGNMLAMGPAFCAESALLRWI